MMPMRPSNDVIELGRSPATGRESFDLLVAAGVISPELATSLKPAVGLRNVLVHLHTDIDVDIVAGSIDKMIEDFGAYVRAVARWQVAQPEVP